MTRRLPRLFLVTSDEVVADPEFPEHAARALAVGGSACALQLRARELPGRRFYDLAGELRVAATRSGASLWINDRVDVALIVRADGVQLGSSGLPTSSARALVGRSCWIGRSVHSPDEAAAAVREGADVALLGNVYATSSHPDRAPLGLPAVREAAAGGRPIVAIGGITPTRVTEVIRAGAWGVAALTAVWGAEDLEGEVRRFLAALEEPAPSGRAVELGAQWVKNQGKKRLGSP